MNRVVLINGHFPNQKRRNSMAWVSEHLQAQSWHVTHVTVGYSWASYLFGDRRLTVLDTSPLRGHIQLSDMLTSLYQVPPIHPFRTNSSLLNMALDAITPLFRAYWRRHLKTPLSQSDLVLCESGAPLLLAPLLSRYAPQAARVYRVNDDIRLLNAPRSLIEAEAQYAKHFTRISSASPRLLSRFTHPNKTHDPMGIPANATKSAGPTPYTGSGKTAVCAGTTQLDIKAILRIATARPDWQIHVIGRTREVPPSPPNVVWQGEQPFHEMLRYVKHADIGLAPYLNRPGVEYQSNNSNRMLLYRHFGLPILGPDRLCHPDLPSIIGYSDPAALDRCENYGRTPETIPDWSELAISLSQNAVMDPPRDTFSVPAMAT